MSGLEQFGRLGQVDLLGVYVEPAVLCLLAGLAVSYGLRVVIDRVGVDHLVWNRALFDLSVLVAVTSLLILALRVPGA